MGSMKHWFIMPLLINLALLFSAGSLLNIIVYNSLEDVLLILPPWILFATIAACAPTFLLVSRMLPDPSIALALGGLLTSAGLLWTGLETGSMQIVSYCVITGAGISFSFQAISIALSPCFIRKNISASVGTLLVSALVMMVSYFVIPHAKVETNSIFLYICPAVLVNSLVPVMVYLHSLSQLSKSKKGKPLYDTDLYSTLAASENLMSDDCINNGKNDSDDACSVKKFTTYDGWPISVMSMIVWLSWGAGVDTTWLSLGWHFQYFSTLTGLASLQLILCFVIFFVKICTEFSQPNNSLYRVNFSNNYMQLGFLGTAGFILCIFPEHEQAFHGCLLFTAGFALQYDDLSDLYLIRTSGLPNPTFKSKIVSNDTSMDDMQDNKRNLFSRICSLLLHVLSILLMSVLAMILGVQVANGVGFLSSVPPLCFLCSRIGLLLMSVAAICISVMRPNFWMRIRTEN